MNKVKPQMLLLCSIIAIGNNRLEQLALDQCHSIDLTYYYRSPYESLIERFYSHVMSRISNQIQSLTLDIPHIPYLINVIVYFIVGMRILLVTQDKNQLPNISD